MITSAAANQTHLGIRADMKIDLGDGITYTLAGAKAPYDGDAPVGYMVERQKEGDCSRVFFFYFDVIVKNGIELLSVCCGVDHQNRPITTAIVEFLDRRNDIHDHPQTTTTVEFLDRMNGIHDRR